MLYLLIPKSKPRTTSPNVFCLGDGIGVTSQFSVEEVVGQLVAQEYIEIQSYSTAVCGISPL